MLFRLLFNHYYTASTLNYNIPHTLSAAHVTEVYCGIDK